MAPNENSTKGLKPKKPVAKNNDNSSAKHRFNMENTQSESSSSELSKTTEMKPSKSSEGKSTQSTGKY